MAKKQICLIVDDNPQEIDYLEKMLKADYKVIIATNIDEAIAAYGQGVAIALVDINLIKFAQDSKLSLGLLKSLMEHEIPTIAITNATDEITVRNAFYEGHVHYFWFKAKDSLSQLLTAIKEAVNKKNLGTSNKVVFSQNADVTTRSSYLIREVTVYVTALVILLTASFCVIGALTISASKIVPENILQNLLITVFSSGTILFILTLSGFGLLLKRITGKQFGEIIKEVFQTTKPDPNK